MRTISNIRQAGPTIFAGRGSTCTQNQNESFSLQQLCMGSIYSEISAYAKKDIISISSASGSGEAITS
jgi:hypothetical protein